MLQDVRPGVDSNGTSPDRVAGPATILQTEGRVWLNRLDAGEAKVVLFEFRGVRRWVKLGQELYNKGLAAGSEELQS
jgi:hypothetical protein